jgi:nitroreductase
MNETLQTIYNRRSIRNFSSQDVSNQDIDTILQAANQAPSAHNQQSWRFIVLRGNKKNELAELITTHAPSFPRPTSALLRMASRSILSAPVVIAVSNTGELINRGQDLFAMNTDQTKDFFRIMEIQSSAAAVENMLIAATSISLASVWLGVLIMIQKEVLSFLGIPEGEFMAVVPVGYAVKTSFGPKKQSLEMLVRKME